MSEAPLRRSSGEHPEHRAAAGAGLSLELGDDGIAVVEFDQPGVEHNRFTPELLQRLSSILDGLRTQAADGELTGLILTSAKHDSFIVGVDVAAIAAVDSAAAGAAAARHGQEVFGKIAELGVPSVVAINGNCLGGATEMALVCTWRLAADSAAVQIGLPEVNLGIFPGFGGSQRLPRLISLERSLRMILTGRPVDAQRAYRIGLIDAVVPAPLLLAEARRWLTERRAPVGGRRRGKRAPEDRSWLRRVRRWLLEGNPLGRWVLFRQARKSVMANTGGHYPAPLAALDTVRQGLRMPLDKALELEAKRVGELAVSPVARNLIGIFFARQAARRRARKGTAGEPRAVHKIAVVGAGVMGGGIAQVAAYNDVPVRMKDVAPEALTAGMSVAYRRFDQRRRRRRISRREVAQKMGLISPTLGYGGFRSADLVIEAIVERLDIKLQVLGEVEAAVRDDAILATNTSSLTVEALADGLAIPERFVGLHFFNPVHRMPLVEVVRGPRSAPEAIDTAASFARRLGKVPVVVGDAPGFFVNRVLTPYLNEALLLVESGVPIERVDRALEGFGMPMGPLRLLDEIGLDVSSHVARELAPLFGERLPASRAGERLLEAGRIGRKGGKGFYDYGGKRPRPASEAEALVRAGARPDGSGADAPMQPTLDEREIVDRCVLLMLNEACYTLGEGIVDSAETADLALVMGTGFAPFRGGIFRYAEERGVVAVRDRLAELAAKNGSRLEPAPLLVERGDSGGAFF